MGLLLLRDHFSLWLPNHSKLLALPRTFGHLRGLTGPRTISTTATAVSLHSLEEDAAAGGDPNPTAASTDSLPPSGSPSTPQSNLRPYQQHCIETCLSRFESGIKRQAVSLPVAAGKTVIFAHLLSKVKDPLPGASKVLVLAHREELLLQAQRKITDVNPHLRVDIEQAENHARPSADVVVASIQTIARRSSNRLSKFNPKHFKLIIIDEAHHTPANSYLWALNHFKVLEKDSHILLWGCSATLNRPDFRPLQPVFEEISYHKGIKDLMEEDWLSRMSVYSIKTHMELKGVSTSSKEHEAGSDFVVAQLAKAIDVPRRNELIVDKWLELSRRENKTSTLVFAANIAHIENLVRTFESRGIRAVGVHARTDREERRQIIQDFKDGEIPVIVNCGVLTEGVDIPNIDCVVMARPTKSHILFVQMLGRGLRKSPGKSSCLVLDFFDTFAGKNLMRVPTLFGLDPSTPLEGDDILEVKEKKERQEKVELEGEIQAQVKSVTTFDPFDSYAKTLAINSKLGWYFIHHFLILPTWKLGDLVIGQKKGQADKFVLAQRMRVPHLITVIKGEFDSADTAVKFAEAYCTQKLGHKGLSPLARGSNWLKKPASDRQVKFLIKLGYRIREGEEEISMGKAQYLIAAKNLKNFTQLDPIKENLFIPNRTAAATANTPLSKRDQMLLNAIEDEEKLQEVEEDEEQEEN